MKALYVITIFAIVFISGCVAYQTTAPEQTAETGELKEFTVEASEFSFNPSSITVNKGDRVKITFKNVGSAVHNFVIDELGVSTNTLSPGGIETIEFIADRSGTSAFYCSIPGHRSAGVEGQITVS